MDSSGTRISSKNGLSVYNLCFQTTTVAIFLINARFGQNVSDWLFNRLRENAHEIFSTRWWKNIKENNLIKPISVGKVKKKSKCSKIRQKLPLKWCNVLSD